MVEKLWKKMTALWGGGKLDVPHGSKAVGGRRRARNEQELKCIPFSVSCPGCQHHQAKDPDTPFYTCHLVSHQILWIRSGPDLWSPIRFPHHCLFVFLVVFCSNWCNSLPMVSLPLGTFLSTLPPQSLQNSNYNIPLLNAISWCPKFPQLRVYIRITWVLFPKFTFLSSTHNLTNQNLWGIGYRVWKRFLVNLMHHPVEESLPYKAKAKLLSIAVKELHARADPGWLVSSAMPVSTSDSKDTFFF